MDPEYVPPIRNPPKIRHNSATRHMQNRGPYFRLGADKDTSLADKGSPGLSSTLLKEPRLKRGRLPIRLPSIDRNGPYYVLMVL